jgi:Flp pilus assembly pilin Flp
MRRGSQRTENESGQTLVEYALIIAIVALGAIIALGFLSGKINTLFSKAGNSVNNVAVADGGSSGGGTPTGPPTPGLVSFTCSGACDDEESIQATTSGWSSGPPILGYLFTWEQNDLSDCSATTGWNLDDTDGGATNPATTQQEQPSEISTLSTDAWRVRVTAYNSSGASTSQATACVIIQDA